MVNSVVGNSLLKLGYCFALIDAVIVMWLYKESSGPDVRDYILHKVQLPMEISIIFCWISELFKGI